jgi:hypothetical protein
MYLQAVDPFYRRSASTRGGMPIELTNKMDGRQRRETYKNTKGI